MKRIMFKASPELSDGERCYTYRDITYTLVHERNQMTTETKTYIGVKIVEARPMTRGEYGDYCGWIGVANEMSFDDGYLVIYPDGYEAWCPKKQFEEANRPTDGMPFGHAIEAAKKGLKIARRGWNGKNMFVVYMPPMWLPPHSSQEPGAKVNDRTAKHIGEDTPLDCQPYFAMRNAQGQWIPGWLASQSDMLADDWIVVES